MIAARFYQGPADGRVLVLPYKEPLERYVIPEFGETLDVEYYYLLSGKIGPYLFSYLYEHTFSL